MGYTPQVPGPSDLTNAIVAEGELPNGGITDSELSNGQIESESELADAEAQISETLDEQAAEE